MAEASRPIYIHTQTLNIRKSNIDQMHVIRENGAEGCDMMTAFEAEGTVESDSASGNELGNRLTFKGHFTEGVAIVDGDPLYGRHEAPNAPTGPGWVKISGRIYMNNTAPLKKGASVYSGKKFFAGEWYDVAVKLVPYTDENFKEVKALLKLGNHQNVIRIYDADVFRQGLISHIYIVMELCPQTLKDYINENEKQMDFLKVFSYAKQIVTGIAYIHKQNILHRDIKLENILISSEGFIRVSDFGLSKQLAEGSSVATSSARGLGTEGYQAPEMLRPNPTASFRSDSFSTGIVLCSLFSCGHHPFGSDSVRWRTNIIDNKSRNLSVVSEFEQPYTKKRAQLLHLLKQSLSSKPRDRPTPGEMLQHAFFTSTPAIRHPVDEESGGWSLAEVKRLLQQFSKSYGKKTIQESFLSHSQIKTELLKVSPKGEEARLLSKVKSLFDNDDAGADYDDDAKAKRISILKEELKKTSQDIGFTKAFKKLNELRALQRTDKVSVLLRLAECELHLKKGNKSMLELEEFIAGKQSLSASDVRDMGFHFYQVGQYVSAIILYRTSHGLYRRGNALPGENGNFITDLVIDVKCAIKPLIEAGGTQRHIATHYGIIYLEEMLDELSAIQTSPDLKALNQARCIVNITEIYNQVYQYQKSIRNGEKGVRILNKQFGENASGYKYYGWLLNNLGTAFRKTRQYSDAQRCYEMALEAKKNVSDYENDQEKDDSLNVAIRNLEKTRMKMARWKHIK